MILNREKRRIGYERKEGPREEDVRVRQFVETGWVEDQPLNPDWRAGIGN